MTKMSKKTLALMIIPIIVVSFVAVSAYTYQSKSIDARETVAYKNPIIIDLYKHAQDSSLVANGWKYLGETAQGYHYQWLGHNNIISIGQEWQNKFIATGAGAGRIMYIGLGTGTYGARTDTSLQGGEVGSGLARAGAQFSAFGTYTLGSQTFTLVNTFTYTGAAVQSNVQLAGLFTSSPIGTGTLWAETTFADLVKSVRIFQSGTVNLSSGDTLTIVGLQPAVKTWTITTGG